jgi:beta-glucosidase
MPSSGAPEPSPTESPEAPVSAERPATPSARTEPSDTPPGVRAAAALLDRGAVPAPPLERATTTPDPRMEAFVDSILALMSLEEKLGQLSQPGGPGPQTGPDARAGTDAEIRAARIGSFLSVNGAELTRQLQRVAVEETRLGIPLMFAHDVIHGFRTIFPVPLGEASTWDPPLIEAATRTAAIEGAAHGIHWTYAPMVDIARDPRWGRIVEGAGEDPYLGSAMAIAKVRGFQGDDLSADNTLLATAKHYAAYGGAEGGRDYNTVDVSERTLREIYLPPFHAAVVAGAQSVMGAFNEVAGIPMHAHRYLIRDVLRGEFGFDGILVSDYTGIREMIQHGAAEDSTAAGVLGLRAGVDIDMVSRIYPLHMPAAVRAGLVEESLVDEAVRRVLRAKYMLGLFEDPYRYSVPERERTWVLTPEHRAQARDVARRSLILLKNDGQALPLRKDLGTIAVIGPLATDSVSILGGWAAAGRPEEAITVLAGIRGAVGPETRVAYARGAPADTMVTSGFDEAVALARDADVAVLVLGEHRDMSAEARNRTSLDLPGVQRELAQAVHATGTPVVVVLLNGRPLSIPWLTDNVPAILEAWFPGTEGGNAIADVLFGDHNPSGKLPVTVPRNVGQVPIYYNHKNTGRPPSEEDWYTSKYIDVPWTPLYAFGHGLSYTTFEYGEPRLSRTTMGPLDSLTVEIAVTNTGDRAGEEVVQLYLRDHVASVTRPVMELRGFEKISLEPGQSQTVSFRIGPSELAFHGPDLRRIIEPGTFTVFVGGSSADTKQVEFTVTGS